MEPMHSRVESLRTPGLIRERGGVSDAELRVFSFGMAHKIHTPLLGRLRALLESSGRSYALNLSAANHETASAGDAEAVFREVSELFDRRLRFLGRLSDLAIVDEIERATFFAAFFPGGVRSNNMTVASAMERGAVVVTNLDAYSPPGLRHMHNVIDIRRLAERPLDRDVLGGIGARARAHAARHSWERLVPFVRGDQAARADRPLVHARAG